MIETEIMEYNKGTWIPVLRSEANRVLIIVPHNKEKRAKIMQANVTAYVKARKAGTKFPRNSVRFYIRAGENY